MAAVDKENISYRTEEARDIIERIPQKNTRIIVMLIISLSGLLLFFGWLIEYPETISGPIIITARQAPVKLMANSTGKLHLLKSNSANLKENEIFAYIDNPAKFNDIITIEESLLKLSSESLYSNPSEVNFLSTFSMGELSQQYYLFLDAIEEVRQYQRGKQFEKKLKRLAKILESQIELKNENIKQLGTRSNTLKIAEKSIHRDSSLFFSSTISEFDLERSRVNYLQILENTQSLEKDNTTIGMQIDDTRYQLKALLLEKDATESNLKMSLISCYNELLFGIRKWKTTYCFISPIEGSLEYMNFWRESDFIMAGTSVFSVLPTDNPLIGQVYLPSYGAGKVKVDQDVIIKLDNYPYLEYGSIGGKIKTISQLSSQNFEQEGQNKLNTYLGTVDLPSDLKTNYGAKLDFRYEIKGIADIITKRRKLIQRLFDNLKYIASKK